MTPVALSQDERDSLMEKLPEEQRAFLRDHVRRGQRTMFARVLARLKGIHVTEGMTAEDLERFVSEWRFIDFQDAGRNYRDSGNLRCECRRVLRYQYTVEHCETGEVLHFGKQHFEMHTGLPAAVVKEICDGFNGVDFELDELLTKLQIPWQLPFDIPSGFDMPEEFAMPMSIGIPLLLRQEERLRRLVMWYEEQVSRRRETRPVTPTDTRPTLPSMRTTQQLPNARFNSGHHLEALASNDVFDDAGYADDAIGARTHDIRGLSHRQEQAVQQYLNEGVESARVMCELLIQHSLAPDHRYSTGKPGIYPWLCVFLDKMCSLSSLECVQRSLEDCVYRRS